MKKLFISLTLLLPTFLYAQSYTLKAGDHFPDIIFRRVVNAPVKQLDLNAQSSQKLFILNEWGTWCSPCIPEMDALAKLQKQYAQSIQVVGVSNDQPKKLVKYALKKPSGIWLVSDTDELLYHMLNLSYVGQAAIVNANKQIVAVVNTDSINSKMIDNLLAGKPVKSSVKTNDIIIQPNTDPFGVDSDMVSSFTIRSYMAGQQSLSKLPRYGKFAFRRITYFNLTIGSLYRGAYDVHSPKEMVYEFDKKKYETFSDKANLYCLDLLVKPAQKDSLLLIMQQKLNESLPVKSRTEMRNMPVYILKKKPGAEPTFKPSQIDHLVYGFSGNGFEGQGVRLDDFAKLYLSNELEYPVVNETGLAGRFDIKTVNDMRDKANIIAAIDKLGLTIEKTERPVRVVILSEK